MKVTFQQFYTEYTKIIDQKVKGKLNEPTARKQVKELLDNMENTSLISEHIIQYATNTQDNQDEWSVLDVDDDTSEDFSDDEYSD